MYNYYKILDISRSAGSDEIKRAYRLKAKLVHPDVNNSPKANEVFAVVSEAYEVLTDENRRYLHDVQLDQVDTLKAEAERKRHYYGSSVKNNSYTNPNFSGMQYEWNNRTTGETSDERHFRQAPISYNLFFASGMVVGFTIMIVSIYGTFHRYWPFPFVAVAVPGFILVREGWRGMMGKASWMGRIFRLGKKE